jgi:CubicO group peptidase (beta-lactamase class C family)
LRLGGVGSALGLAQVYAASTGLTGHQILDDTTIATMSQQQAWGLDRVLDQQSCFGTVFMKPQPRMEFGSYQAFGHDGFGGAIGFADPMYHMSFGYIPASLSSPPGADRRAIELSHLVRRCIRHATGW